MKRESIIAIVLGVILGIGVGVVILSKTNKNVAKEIEKTTSELKANVKNKNQPSKKTLFTISSPANGTTVHTKSITIKGMGTKDSLIVALSANGNKTIKLDKDEYSLDMPLALGENSIDLTYYPKDGGGDFQEKQLVIYYLPE